MTKFKPIPDDAEAAAAAKPAADSAKAVSDEQLGNAAEGPSSSDADLEQASYVDRAISEVGDIEPAADGADKLHKMQAELASAEQQVLRAHAELENYRKRANRLLEEERKYAPLPLMRDLLPILDNLERAIRSASQDGGAAGLLEGVTMVVQQLSTILQQHHCRRIEAQGAVFDPHVHEALAQVASDQVPPGTVLDVALPGYRLHDRVIRPSQVLVSSRPAGNAEEST